MEEMKLKQKFESENCWGILVSIDAIACDPDSIRNKEMIKEYVKELCTTIKMQRYGDCEVVHFGEDEKVAGFSMTQLIETSLISGHFSNKTNNAYIDVFSCRWFSPDLVKEFTKNYFNASEVKSTILLRK